jgi:hypothetical protein
VELLSIYIDWSQQIIINRGARISIPYWLYLQISYYVWHRWINSAYCDLLIKSREIYEILISGHCAMHREYRNAQLNQVHKFKTGDIVFTNVQVQSKKSSGTVAKLAYICRGPYKIIKSFNSSTYQLQLINGKSKAIIKKHSSDLFLSPKSLIPHSPIHSASSIRKQLKPIWTCRPWQICPFTTLGNADSICKHYGAW